MEEEVWEVVRPWEMSWVRARGLGLDKPSLIYRWTWPTSAKAVFFCWGKPQNSQQLMPIFWWHSQQLEEQILSTPFIPQSGSEQHITHTHWGAASTPMTHQPVSLGIICPTHYILQSPLQRAVTMWLSSNQCLCNCQIGIRNGYSVHVSIFLPASWKVGHAGTEHVFHGTQAMY